MPLHIIFYYIPSFSSLFLLLWKSTSVSLLKWKPRRYKIKHLERPGAVAGSWHRWEIALLPCLSCELLWMGGSRAGQTPAVLRAGSAQHPHAWELPWSSCHLANTSWGMFLSVFELLLCVLEKELCLSDAFELELVAHSLCGLVHAYLPTAVGKPNCWLTLTPDPVESENKVKVLSYLVF